MAVGSVGGPYMIAAVIMDLDSNGPNRTTSTFEPRARRRRISVGFLVSGATKLVAGGWSLRRDSMFLWSSGAMPPPKLLPSATSAHTAPFRYRLDGTMVRPWNVLIMAGVSMRTAGSAAWFLPSPSIPSFNATASTREAFRVQSATDMYGRISTIPRDARLPPARPQRQNCRNIPADIASSIFPQPWPAAWTQRLSG